MTTHPHTPTSNSLTVEALEQCTVVDRDGAAVGKVKNIYLDNTTRRPSWVSVHTGLFGLHETLIPVDDAHCSAENELQVPYEKAYIHDAPHVDVERALTPADEAELYTYYGLEGAAEQARRDDTSYLGGTTEEFLPGEMPSTTHTAEPAPLTAPVLTDDTAEPVMAGRLVRHPMSPTVDPTHR